jgi:hypothetical protein
MAAAFVLLSAAGTTVSCPSRKAEVAAPASKKSSAKLRMAGPQESMQRILVRPQIGCKRWNGG